MQSMKRMNCWIRIAGVVLAASLLLSSPAGARLNQDELRAAYMLRLLRYITWPSETFTNNQLVIGILGQSPVSDLIDEGSAGRVVNGRNIVIHRLSSVDSSNWNDCHLIFVAKSEDEHLDEILQQVDRWTLTASDLPDFPQRGGTIGFKKVGITTKPEINMTLIDWDNFKINSKVLSMATLVEE